MLVLTFNRWIYGRYFEYDQVLKTVRKEVLKGCKVVFSHVFPTSFPAEDHSLWKMAEKLGATCCNELDPSITHVVSTDAGTRKSHWAMKEKKFLVHPRWIEASNYMWQKQPEENFPVSQPKKWLIAFISGSSSNLCWRKLPSSN